MDVTLLSKSCWAYAVGMLTEPRRAAPAQKAAPRERFQPDIEEDVDGAILYKCWQSLEKEDRGAARVERVKKGSK